MSIFDKFLDIDMEDEYKFEQAFNPANGLPMINSVVDIEGNLYGSDNSEIFVFDDLTSNDLFDDEYY